MTRLGSARPLPVFGVFLIFAFASGCSRTPGNFPIGGDPHSLPAVGAAPLIAMVPAQAEAVLALRNPATSLEELRASGLWRRLEQEGWFQDSLALPPVERWRAMQAKLSELARSPLPDAEALLQSPAVLALARQSGDRAGGLLYIARIGPSASRAFGLARALNAVRASGREVEVERIRGIAVREVSFGNGAWFPPGQRLIYAVLADRLLLSTDEPLLSQALQLALDGHGRSLGSRTPFADLEARAQSVGFAAAWMPPANERLAPGVRSAELDGRDLTLQLDPALWSESSVRPAPDPTALLQVGLAGLDLRAALAKLRPQLETPASESLLQRLDALAGSLGPGLFVQVVPRENPGQGISVAVDVLRQSSPSPGLPDSSGSPDSNDAPVAALAAVLLEHPGPAEPIEGGRLHCSAEDEVCLASCEHVVRLAWPGAYLRERGCPALRNAAPSDLLVAIGGQSPLLSAELREGRGQLLFPGP